MSGLGIPLGGDVEDAINDMGGTVGEAGDASVGLIGPNQGVVFAYLERLSDGQRWLLTVGLAEDAILPTGTPNHVDLTGDGNADLSVGIGVSFATAGGGLQVDRARIETERVAASEVLPAFRIVARADSGAVWPADGPDDEMDQIRFAHVGFGTATADAHVPDRLVLTIEPRGLDPAARVQRTCAVGDWPVDPAENDGSEFGVTVEIVDGPAPTVFEVVWAAGAEMHDTAANGALLIASPTASPYVELNAASNGAIVAIPPATAAEAMQITLSLATTGALRTDTVLDACLFLDPDDAAALLDRHVALELSADVVLDLDLQLTTHDAATAASTTTIVLDAVPTSLSARLLPSRNTTAEPPPAVDGSGQDAWLAYRAGDTLGRLELDVPGTIGVQVHDLPSDVGVTAAGGMTTTFLARVGLANDLSSPLPTGIGRAVVELGAVRSGAPTDAIDVRLLAGGDTRIGVPGLSDARFRIGLGPTADGPMLERPLVLQWGFDPDVVGAALPATLELEDVGGLSGTGELDHVPLDGDVTNAFADDSGTHDLALDVGETRFGDGEADLQRPDTHPDGAMHLRLVTSALTSVRAVWTDDPASDAPFQVVDIGRIDDVASSVPGGLGAHLVVIDDVIGAPHTLVPLPELRLELTDAHVLVGASRLGRVHVDVTTADVVVFDLAAAALWRPRMPQQQFGVAVLVALQPEDADDSPTRTLLHIGNLANGQLAGTLTTAEDQLRVELTGRLERVKVLHLDTPTPTDAVAHTADGVRVEVGVPTTPRRSIVQLLTTPRPGTAEEDTELTLDTDGTGALVAEVSLHDPAGLGPVADEEGDLLPIRHINSSLAVPSGTTRAHFGAAVEISANAPGLTGRVAIASGIDGLTAVRATPQIATETEARADGKQLVRSLTARVYGLQEARMESNEAWRDDDIGLLTHRADSALSIGLAPDRPNTSLRITTRGIDTPGAELRDLGRTRLSGVADSLNIVSRTGVELPGTEAELTAGGGAIAAEGETWSEPPIIPWEGPDAGTVIGTGLAEMVFESMPTRLRLVKIPLERIGEIAGALQAEEGRIALGNLFEVEGELRLRNVLQLDWDRTRGSRHKLTLSKIACLRVSSDGGPGELWIRQLGKRNVAFGDEEPQFNVVTIGPATATMATDAYETFRDSGPPFHWTDLNGAWDAAAKVQLKGFSGWLQVGIGLPPSDDDVQSGDWWLRAVDGMEVLGINLPGDVSLGSTSGTMLDKNPINDVCGG